jgi:MFS transporter, MHS family, shikimate and dehydroshikimate transport protein
LVARYKLSDSPIFEQLKRREQLARLPSFGVFREHAVPILTLAVVIAFQTVEGAVTGAYMISFMHFAEIPLATIAVIIFISRIADVAGVVLSGPLADLCRRKVVAYLALGVTTILSYPFVRAILGKHILRVGCIQFLIVLLGMGVMHGLTPILTSESFPTKFRYSGSGISFGLGGVLGGMIAPTVLAKLIGADVLHKWYYVPLLYAVYCGAAMFALLFIRETRDTRLEELDRSPSNIIETRLGVIAGSD